MKYQTLRQRRARRARFADLALRMISGAGAAVAAVALGALMARAVMTADAGAACRIEVTDSRGDLWIAGAGRTVAQAWRGARMPDADWREIRAVCD